MGETSRVVNLVALRFTKVMALSVVSTRFEVKSSMYGKRTYAHGRHESDQSFSVRMIVVQLAPPSALSC
jgi:hypothetical protein